MDIGHNLNGSTRAWWSALAGAALGAAALLAPQIAAASPGAQAALTGKAEVERGFILEGATRPVYVLVRFEAPEFDIAPRSRPPLNLSLVLDRSGSMADRGKIEYLREAAKLAIGRLGSRDIVSVVEFDDEITLMWPAGRADRTRGLDRLIDGLEPRGSTNLTGGMMRGVEEAMRAQGHFRLDREALSRVLLLSDGLANVGVTDPREIGRLVRGARRGGVRVSTIGLGLDYDEDLMQAIAENGGGKYYYVEHPTQLARIFEEELKTMFATAARDVRLKFRGGRYIHSCEIVGFASASGGEVSADWPDFYSGEKRSVLLRLEVDAQEAGALDLGTLEISWRDARTGAEDSAVQRLGIEVSRDKDLVERSVNADVAVEAALVESERALEENVKLYQEGRHDEARARNDTVIRELAAKNATLKDERIARKIEALNVEQSQMEAAAGAPAMQADYLKATKQRLYQAKSGKRSLYVLKPGDSGLEVERLQQALKDAGYYQGDVDGTFDEDVKTALEAYQDAQGLQADGIAGAATQQSLGLY